MIDCELTGVLVGIIIAELIVIAAILMWFGVWKLRDIIYWWRFDQRMREHDALTSKLLHPYDRNGAPRK